MVTRDANAIAVPVPNAPGAYQQGTLPNLAPAAPFSPDIPREPTMLTASFRVASTGATPLQAPVQPPSYPMPPHQGYPQQIPPHQGFTPINEQHVPPPQPPVAIPPQLPSVPIRPPAPFDQFNDHMVPQLEADHYPQDQIHNRIRHEWTQLSQENRKLWEQRYNEQMSDYERDMDNYKREQRKYSNLNGGLGGSFSAVSQ